MPVMHIRTMLSITKLSMPLMLFNNWSGFSICFWGYSTVLAQKLLGPFVFAHVNFFDDTLG